MKSIICILLAIVSHPATYQLARAKSVPSPPPPKAGRPPNPPSPPNSILPLSSADNCDLVLVYNATNGDVSRTPRRQAFRLTIRNSWPSIVFGGVNRTSRLQEFINDTRDALAIAFEVRV